ALTLKKVGTHASAETLFLSLIEKDQNNAELWFQLGLVQRFQEKRAEAMASQEKALALSPENHDIRLELARLHSWNQNYELAESMVQEVLAAHPDYADAQALAASITRAKNAPPDPKSFKSQMDFGYENSDFSRRPQPDWHQYFLQIGHWMRDDTLVHFRTENIERRKVHNEHYELGIVHIFNDVYNVHISVGYTPDSMFIPKWRIKTGGEARLIFDHKHLGNTWLMVHFQHDRYTTLETTVIKPGIRYQFLDNWQIHANQINVIDENNKHLEGWSTRLDWQTPLPELRIFSGLSNAPETEDFLTVNTKAHFGGFSYQMTPRIAVHASYAREDRENSFIRHIVSTAISVKF
ncbi:MAG: YaiO family outer membrane beta-barrel protein, partial [Gammaproteobacteria bacterium]